MGCGLVRLARFRHATRNKTKLRTKTAHLGKFAHVTESERRILRKAAPLPDQVIETKLSKPHGAPENAGDTKEENIVLGARREIVSVRLPRRKILVLESDEEECHGHQREFNAGLAYGLQLVPLVCDHDLAPESRAGVRGSRK